MNQCPCCLLIGERTEVVTRFFALKRRRDLLEIRARCLGDYSRASVQGMRTVDYISTKYDQLLDYQPKINTSKIINQDTSKMVSLVRRVGLGIS